MIRRDYRDIRTIAGLGALAGRAAAEMEERKYQQQVEQEKRRQKFEVGIMKFREEMDREALKASQMWELEKMQTRSRLDFEREERERVRELDRIDNALRQIDREVESGHITEAQAAPLRFSYEMKKYDVDTPISLIQPPKEEDPIKKYIRESLSDAGTASITNFLKSEEAAATAGIPTPSGHVRVLTPDGREGTIPVEDLEEALAEGYTLISAPAASASTPVTAGVSKTGVSKAEPLKKLAGQPLDIWELIWELGKRLPKKSKSEKLSEAELRSLLWAER